MANRAPSSLLSLLVRRHNPLTFHPRPLSKPKRPPLHHRHCRPLTTSSQSYQSLQPTPPQDPITPAPPLDLSSLPPPTTENARLVPASPSYFTTKPATTDDLLHLQQLQRRYELLPKLPPAEAPRSAWKKLVDYRLSIGEEVPAARYTQVLKLLAKLNLIPPEIMPKEVKAALDWHRRAIDPLATKRRVEVIDEWGRGRGVGKRKSTTAQVWLVEGEGEVLVNGKRITQVFGRLHDREAALWPLIALGRMGRYNVFAKVSGGGTTGWAEGMAMGVGRALLVHEPALKPALRRVGVIRRDPRRVERKKPGHVKARKMPTWVKR